MKRYPSAVAPKRGPMPDRDANPGSVPGRERSRRVIGLVLMVLSSTACDGDVEGWTLPNFPGDGGSVDASMRSTDASVSSNVNGSESSTTSQGDASVTTVPSDAGSTTDGMVGTSCRADCGAVMSSDPGWGSEDVDAASDGGTADGGVSVCGDGVVEAAEECDDANSANEDGCDNACQKSTCGDGVIEDAEQCDPPTTSGHCGTTCRFLPPRCGDGVLQREDGEGCDDGNSAPDDGCFECANACGNGKIDPDETCEPGFATLLCLHSWNTCIACSVGDENCEARDVCDAETCKGRSACGNGRVETGESCDPPGSVYCDHKCQSIPRQCGNGIIEFGEDCDPSDGVFCNEACEHISCGNGALEGQEECDPPNGFTCSDACTTVLPCEPSAPPASILPVDGAFTSGIMGWLAPDKRVSLTHDTTEGATEQGALLIGLDNGSAGGAPIEIRGATLCLPVAHDTAYSFSGWYKFPTDASDTRDDTGTSVSLYLYSNLSCAGDPLEASKVRGHRGAVSQLWQSYQTTMRTSQALEPGELLSMMIRVDVWRPADLTRVDVLWDDVQLTNVAVQSEGYCGDCRTTGAETCDDGNQLEGDGCNALCTVEGCRNGVVDEREQCDDGNLTFQDGCDPDCTTGDVCRGCAFAQCTEAATACYQDPTLVTEGIGEGKSVGLLCSGLAECIERTGCALDTAVSSLEGLLSVGKAVENCYCGTARSEDCFGGGANGSCRLEIEAAVETSDPLLVVQRMGISDDTYPAFRHAVSVWSCVTDPLKTCAESCVGQPVCGNGKLGERPQSFESSVPGMFDGSVQSTLTCEELAMDSCFFEQCDDGNVAEADGCDAHCYREQCGNGILQLGSGEACDDGNVAPEDGCSPTCQFEWVCGDEQVDPNEDCDDGNDVVGDGCDLECYHEECGNSVVQINEQCDPPNGSQCLEGCVFAPSDPCTTCLMEMGSEPAWENQQCPGALTLDGDPDMDISYTCLADPLCKAVWNCFIETHCGQVPETATVNDCYCGSEEEDRAQCQSNPEFVPQGSCAAEMMAAYEGQFGEPAAPPPLFLQYVLEYYNADKPSLGAATLPYFACLQSGNYVNLDIDMCYAGFSPERRVECSHACFGEAGLTEDEVVGEDCAPLSVAQ